MKSKKPKPYYVVFADSDGAWLTTYPSYKSCKEDGLFPSSDGPIFEIFYKGNDLFEAERWLDRALSLTGE